MYFPTPQKIDAAESVAIENPRIKLIIDDERLISERTKYFGTSFDPNGNVVVKAISDNTARLGYIEKCSRVTDEKFILKIEKSDAGVLINLEYSGKRSLWYALNAVEKMAKNTLFPIGHIEDYPLFKKRGFIEGFYGKTWLPEQRLDMLRLAAQNGMNTFYYAPKDDPFHRRLWKELYPQKELSDLAELVKACEIYCIDFHYCIAPGLSMRYTSDEDFTALKEKTLQLYSIGVRGFGLLLDDIPHELSYPEDIAAYGETVNAHIDLVNRYYNVIYNIDKTNRLTVCPMQYHGKGTEYQISKFGQGIVPEAELFWTGNEICSREITVPEAVRFIDATTHRPLYWDNYPVNDAEMHNEMHIGPIMGRDENLYHYSSGIIANCMEYFECTKLPLMTIADYLWNPLAYEKEKSYVNALETIIGAENIESFLLFADNTRISCLHDSNSEIMSDVLGRANAEIIKANPAGALTLLSEYIEKLKQCAAMLTNTDIPLYKELRRWSEKFAECTQILELGLKYLTSGDKKLKDELSRRAALYHADATVLTGFCFREFTEFIEEN